MQSRGRLLTAGDRLEKASPLRRGHATAWSGARPAGGESKGRGRGARGLGGGVDGSAYRRILRRRGGAPAEGALNRTRGKVCRGGGGGRVGCCVQKSGSVREGGWGRTGVAAQAPGGWVGIPRRLSTTDKEDMPYACGEAGGVRVPPRLYRICICIHKVCICIVCKSGHRLRARRRGRGGARAEGCADGPSAGPRRGGQRRWGRRPALFGWSRGRGAVEAEWDGPGKRGGGAAGGRQGGNRGADGARARRGAGRAVLRQVVRMQHAPQPARTHLCNGDAVSARARAGARGRRRNGAVRRLPLSKKASRQPRHQGRTHHRGRIHRLARSLRGRLPGRRGQNMREEPGRQRPALRGRALGRRGRGGRPLAATHARMAGLRSGKEGARA
ncbi:MAG: hypothetical protein J3K34DRAFT_120810 [Monoraphidium minutum]|nr:MAG: hypothetical protein J3K34DRAFT_120810 [Monoraphidium minutum]